VFGVVDVWYVTVGVSNEASFLHACDDDSDGDGIIRREIDRRVAERAFPSPHNFEM